MREPGEQEGTVDPFGGRVEAQAFVDEVGCGGGVLSIRGRRGRVGGGGEGCGGGVREVG